MANSVMQDEYSWSKTMMRSGLHVIAASDDVVSSAMAPHVRWIQCETCDVISKTKIEVGPARTVELRSGELVTIQTYRRRPEALSPMQSVLALGMKLFGKQHRHAQVLSE